MGCDIHIILEKRAEDGRWIGVNGECFGTGGHNQLVYPDNRLWRGLTECAE